MGHEVTHLNRRLNLIPPTSKKVIAYPLRYLRNILTHSNIPIRYEEEKQKIYDEEVKCIEPFYDKYIKHTSPFTRVQSLFDYLDYDAFIVGSDQVWRKSMMYQNALNHYFFDYVPDEKIKIAYAASFGTDENELSTQDVAELGKLYRRFKAVSVREDGGCKLIQRYGWSLPQPVRLLDPTFLLVKEDYIQLIKAGETSPTADTMFCYILDTDKAKDELINRLADSMGWKAYRIDLDSNHHPSIEQWLKSFHDAKFVVTDSYHGFVFSIIFNKPYRLIFNKRRGNSRFETLLKLFGLTEDGTNVDWDRVNAIIQSERKKAIDFLAYNIEGRRYAK